MMPKEQRFKPSEIVSFGILFSWIERKLTRSKLSITAFRLASH